MPRGNDGTAKMRRRPAGGSSELPALEDSMEPGPGRMLQEHDVCNTITPLIARAPPSTGHGHHEWDAKLPKVIRGRQGAKKSWKVQTELTATGTAESCGRCSCLCLLLGVVRVFVPVLLAFVSFEGFHLGSDFKLRKAISIILDSFRELRADAPLGKSLEKFHFEMLIEQPKHMI